MSGFSLGIPHQVAFQVVDRALHWSTMETSLFDTICSRRATSRSRARLENPFSSPSMLLFPLTPADRCRKLIDETKEFLQRVYENQHRINEDSFTKITEETTQVLKTLVMWEKHGFSEGPQSYHEIEQLLNMHPTFTELCDVLLPKLAPMWKAFCTVINFDDDGTTLAIIDQKYHGDPEDCCREVLQRWLRFKRPTWQEVIDCLRQAKCTQLADDVEKVVVHDKIPGSTVAIKKAQLKVLWKQYRQELMGGILCSSLTLLRIMKPTTTRAYEDRKIVTIYNGEEKLTAVYTTIEDDLILQFTELKGKVAAFFEHEASEILKQLKKKTSSAGACREWHMLGQLLISLRFIHSQVGG